MDKEKLKESLIRNTNYMFKEKFYDILTNNVFNDLFGTESNYGYVYFIRVRNKSLCKIGMTNNIMSRINSFKTTLGNDIQLDGFIYSQKYKELEKNIHKLLEHKRTSGEWFDLKISESIDVLKSENGVLCISKIDNNLIINDGLFISGKKNIIVEQNNLTGKINVVDEINKFLNDNDLNLLYASLKEIRLNILKGFTLSQKELMSILTDSYKIYPLKRYKSFFDKITVVGKPFELVKL